MPINQPTPDRVIAPNSLAFQRQKNRGQATVSYQNITNSISESIADITADRPYVDRSIAASQISERDAELRAKHFVGDWHHRYLWTIGNDVTLTHNVITPVPFQTEVQRCQGVTNDRRLNTARPTWRHVVQPGQEGTYHVYAHLSLTTPGTGFATLGARMYLVRNGGIYHMIDWINADTYNETDLETVKLAGATSVHVYRGDTVEIHVILETTGIGDITFLAPTSVFGYVTGHHTSCDSEMIATPNTGVSFDTTP